MTTFTNFINQHLTDSLTEANKIVLKRAYTESKPAITAGKIAAVRNKMLETVKDGKMSQDQFNTILKEYSKDTGRWMKRNAKFFNVSEEGVSLSKYGKKALSQITINEDGEVEEGRAFVAAAKKAKEEGKKEFEFDGNKFPVTIKEGNAFIYAAAKAKRDGKKEFEFNGKTYKVTLKADTNLKENKVNMKNQFVFESFSAFVESLNEAEKLCEATLEIEAANSDEEGFLNLLKKNNVKIIKKVGQGHWGPTLTLQGKRKDLATVILDKTWGWDDPSWLQYIKESVINEAFKSAKLASILTGANQMPKDLASAFYGMSKLALDQIEDVDIIEMDPQTAKKEKRNSAVYLYFTTNEKENTFARGTSNIIIPANTLLAITDGKNEWMNTAWSGYKGARYQTLSVTKRDDSAGIQKSSANTGWGTGISSMKQVVELADRAYCLDLDVLRARYSTANKRAERTEARKGATAFKNDKDFKAENMARYHNILANRAAEMPIDREVQEAIDIVAQQIKEAVGAGKKTKYNDILVGLSPNNKEITLKDASNITSGLLDDFGRYVEYTNNTEKEKEAGYAGDYYSRKVKEYAKRIMDKIKKIKDLDYAW
jgi:hypothetical protein